MTTIAVQYVGRKPFAVDNVAHSGKTWEGAGSVQQVSVQQAKVLTSYKDQWQLENPDDQELLDAPTVILLQDASGDEVQVDPAALDKHLEKMTANELRAYAQEKYGKQLGKNKAKTVLLNEVLALEGGATVV